MDDSQSASESSGGERSKSQAKKERRRERAKLEKAQAEKDEALRKEKETLRRRKEEQERKRREDEFANFQERQRKKKSGTTIHLGEIDYFFASKVSLGSDSACPAEGSREPSEQSTRSAGVSREPREQSGSSGEVRDPPKNWLAAFGAQTRSVDKEKAIADAKEKNKETDDDFAALFKDLLTTHTKTDDGNNGEKCFYPAQVACMKILGTYKLTVDFMDVLVKKKYKSLAIRIGKDDTYLWLHQLAEFLH